jgi:hypothetical protein
MRLAQGTLCFGTDGYNRPGWDSALVSVSDRICPEADSTAGASSRLPDQESNANRGHWDADFKGKQDIDYKSSITSLRAGALRVYTN